MSVGNYSHTTRAVGTVLTANIYNGDHQNHITNSNPTGVGGYSDSVAQMQAATDPGESGSESLAGSLAGELERLRYAIREVKGTTHWYQTPLNSLFGPVRVISNGTESVTAADGGKVLWCAGTGNVTLNLTAASTLGAGFVCAIFGVSKSNTITIVPNSGDFINGTGELMIVDGQGSVMLSCNGVGFGTVAYTQGPAATDLTGHCRLNFSSATELKLERYNGSTLPMQLDAGMWQPRRIPSAGVTVSNASLAADTLYYVYAFTSSGGVFSLQMSTEAYAVNADTGIPVRASNATETLVGMVRTNGSSQFSSFLVSSYFNRRSRGASTGFSASRSTASTSAVEINTEIRNTFLTWADEDVLVMCSGRMNHDSIGGAVAANLTIDGATHISQCGGTAGNAHMPCTMTGRVSLAEGYHYATLFGFTDLGNATWTGAASHTTTGPGTVRTTIQVLTRG